MEANITPYVQALEEFKRDYWTWLIAKAGGSVSLCARLAGVNRTHAYEVLARYNIPYIPAECGHRGKWGNLSNEEPQPRYSPPVSSSG
jgi:DNA-binding NtrC family response regulator